MARPVCISMPSAPRHSGRALPSPEPFPPQVHFGGGGRQSLTVSVCLEAPRDNGVGPMKSKEDKHLPAVEAGKSEK